MSFSFASESGEIQVWKGEKDFWFVAEGESVEAFPNLEAAILHLANNQPRKKPELHIVKNEAQT